jgi:predicted DNA-binding transcriptional regulator YafY
MLPIDFGSVGRLLHLRSHWISYYPIPERMMITIWCENANDFRHLRVDRIGLLEDTGETFRDERGKRFSDCLAKVGNPTGLKRPS